MTGGEMKYDWEGGKQLLHDDDDDDDGVCEYNLTI